MKYIKKFEERNIFGQDIKYEYPAIFKDGTLFNYYMLMKNPPEEAYTASIPYEERERMGFDYLDEHTRIQREGKKELKKLKKEILGYINEYINKYNSFGMREFKEDVVEITDFELEYNYDGDYNDYTVNFKGINLTYRYGIKRLRGKDFEEIIEYTNNPDLYQDMKKYNI